MFETHRVSAGRWYWRSWALLALCACVLTALFRLGIGLGMDRTFFGFRYLAQGQVITALSHMIPGQPRDYTWDVAVRDVAAKYWDTDHQVPLAAIVEEARQAIAAKSDGSRGPTLDDKGFVDWVTLAFKLFGFHKRSVYNTYFILLIAPMCLYAAYWFKQPAHLFVLVALAIALYVTAPILVIDDQLSSLHEQRFFAVVGFVPALTLLLVMREAAVTPGAVVMVLLQAAALVFVYYCRNDSIWLTLCVAAAIPLFFWRLRHRFVGRRLQLAGRLVWPLLAIACGLVALDGYKRAHFAPAYFKLGYAAHVWSHGLAMGLSYNPRLAKQYDLAIDDMAVIRLVGRTMTARGEPVTDQGAVDIFNSDFNRYNREVRLAAWEVVKAHPVESALSFGYKIPAMIHEFLYATGYREDNRPALRAGHTLVSPALRKAGGLYYRPFAPIALAVIAVAALLASSASPDDWRAVRLVVTLLAAGALLVPLGVFAMMYLMGPLFVAVALFAYVAVVSTAIIYASRRSPRAAAGPEEAR